ncbi:glycosyltransferase [Streptomyces sp. PKU-EA00015]|uniref:glycosyltransferase n=1 Tax=Streptomyces sp. PKU-EA00015 TaxID=2748326 RepID=UPI0015A44FEF|nr:glycosyltransferase [Streptomyces sp. PKU-EA00015]NWF25740.1 glycosyltransferase [Streptomyces sp. PKU-EA00015]
MDENSSSPAESTIHSTIEVVVPVRLSRTGPPGLRLDRLTELEACIESVLHTIRHNQDEAESANRWHKASLTVVDDHSEPPLEEQLPRALRDQLAILPNRGTAGQAGALNYALSRTSASHVAFTDSDCTVAPDWLSSIAHHYSRHPDHIGVAGPSWLFGRSEKLWSRYVTLCESELMRYSFTRYVDRRAGSSSRLDCRNLSLEVSGAASLLGDRFFTEGRGPSVSGQTSHRMRAALSRAGRTLGYSDAMTARHKPVSSVKETVATYYLRGREGTYRSLYAPHGSLGSALGRRYLMGHFVRPALASPGTAWYALVAHTAYWIGIAKSA